MPTRNGKSVSAIPGIYLRSRDAIHDAVLEFAAVNTAPTTTSGYYYLYVDGGALKYNNGITDVTLGAAGGGGVPTWESIYAVDGTFGLTTAVWTITQSAAAGLLSLNKTNVGAGTVLALANSGSGKDLSGPSWSFISTGAVGILEMTTGGTINATDGALSIGKTGTATTLVGTCTVAEGLTVTTGNTVLTNGNLTLTAGNLVATLGNVTVTNGLVSLTSTSNIAAGVSLLNNTITTYGAAAASGAVEIASTSLTTGTLLHLELTEGTLNGGFYLRCWDVTAGAANFTIGEDGAVSILGIAAGGTDVLTITKGDAVLSDGSLTITDADNAATLSVTNATATTASVVALTGGGAFTGTGATSFMTLTPTGMTTGTALYVLATAATTSVGVVDVISAGLTTGSLMRLTTNTAAFTTGGKALEISLVAAVAGNGVSVTTTGAYTGTGLGIFTAGAMTTGVVMQLTSTTGLTSGSLLRATTSTAGAVATNGIISLRATGVYTSTSNAGLLDVAADATTAGTVFNLVGNTLTTGVLMNMSATAAYTGAGLINLVTGATTGTIALITANAFTTGVGLSIASTSATLTTGSLFKVSTGTTGAVATNGVVALVASGNYSSTSNAGLLNLSAAATTAGTILNIINTAMTTGVAINVVGTAAYTGTGVVTVTSAATTGVIELLAGAAMTSGIGLKVSATAATLTTGRYFSAFDGALEVFGIGANGHIHTLQTTAPTIAVTAQNGITAAAITAGATDSNGIITTTGTNNNGGATVLQITFHKTYTTAPKTVILQPRNLSGQIIFPYVSAVAATTFDITIPASAASGATPSWNYLVIA